MLTSKLALNPDLNVAELSKDFQENKRIRIRNFFTNGSAQDIERTLRERTPWQLAYTDATNKPCLITNDQLNRMNRQEMGALLSSVHSRAISQYQFAYKTFHTISAIKKGLVDQNSPIYDIASFLNGVEFINFARALTGNNDLVKMDPQLTLYEANHFLNLHNDNGDERDTVETGIRRFAVVFGFTKDWNVNWGGNTTFYEHESSKEGLTWYPDFNTMSIFEVPVLHRVNMVVPFAQRGRYSITGWLREDPSIVRADLNASE